MTIAAPLAELGSILDEMTVLVRNRLIKSSAPGIRQRQQKLLPEMAKEMADDLAAYFGQFARRGIPIRKAVDLSWDPEDDIDWEVEAEDLGEVFGTWYARVGTSTYDLVGEQLGTEVSWDLNARGVKNIMGLVGTRVTGILDTSRDTLQRYVDTAIDHGFSIEQLVNGEGGFAGLEQLVASWASTDPGGAASRAQTIALTETANAYSLASIAGYRDSGLVDEVEVLDGEDCGWTEHDDPDLADGSIRTLDEADEYPISHPNCQRAFAPVAAR